MKQSERTYSQMLGLLRDLPTPTSFTPEEIQSLIERDSTEPARVPPRFDRRRVRRLAIVTALVGGTLTGILLFPTKPDTHDRMTVRTEGASSSARTPASGQAPVGEKSAVVRREPPTSGAPTVTVPSENAGGSRHPVTAGVTAPKRVRSASRPTVAEAPPPSRETIEQSQPKHLEISTLPMLELSREELKALGVTFVGGGIETVCEEYYTLATAQDRATFARMGIDTTRRTGIVRRRLTIDTFGLTTQKHSWTRVENYSRIAPIIALNSYVMTEHSGSVILNSFTHSPIMDLARRSIDSMATFLPEGLTSDNVDKIMHDSDQANPARILVPVHIRLGDEAIGGSTKRRGADIILWYYPTPEFAAALPARYRTPLQRELNVLADVVECNLPPREACRQMTGEPLLVNYCKRASGALSGLNVSPNPARTSLTMRYMLQGERTITAALYDMRGKYVRELLPATTVGAGTHAASVELGETGSGAYMVVLRSAQGEQVSERLIVQ